MRKIGKKEPLTLRIDFYRNIPGDLFFSLFFTLLHSHLPKSVGNIGSRVGISSRCQSISAISHPRFQTRHLINARASMSARRKIFIKMLTSYRQHSANYRSIPWTLNRLESVVISSRRWSSKVSTWSFFTRINFTLTLALLSKDMLLYTLFNKDRPILTIFLIKKIKFTPAQRYDFYILSI